MGRPAAYMGREKTVALNKKAENAWRMIEAVGLDGLTPSGLLAFLLATTNGDTVERADLWEQEARELAAQWDIELDEDRLYD